MESIPDIIAQMLFKHTEHRQIPGKGDVYIFNSPAATEDIVQLMCDREVQRMYNAYKAAGFTGMGILIQDIKSKLFIDGEFRPFQIERAISKLVQ